MRSGLPSSMLGGCLSETGQENESKLSDMQLGSCGARGWFRAGFGFVFGVGSDSGRVEGLA